ISEYNAKEIQSDYLLDIIMRWCVIDTYQRSHIVTDIGKESFSWNNLKGFSRITTEYYLIFNAIKIYKNAECNKNICLIMTNQVKDAERAIETIINIDDEETFHQRKYYIVFKRFENILANVKEFTKNLSMLKKLTEKYSKTVDKSPKKIE
ncbi:23501_t:CDS:2, partial [Gigaspora margarita]